MHEQETKPETTSPSWLAHDLIVGLLAGTGVGTIVGLSISVRVPEDNLFGLAGAIIGAIIGILLLVRSHQRHDRFLTTAVVVSWILLVLSVAFIALVIDAIANFS